MHIVKKISRQLYALKKNSLIFVLIKISLLFLCLQYKIIIMKKKKLPLHEMICCCADLHVLNPFFITLFFANFQSNCIDYLLFIAFFFLSERTLLALEKMGIVCSNLYTQPNNSFPATKILSVYYTKWESFRFHLKPAFCGLMGMHMHTRGNPAGNKQNKSKSSHLYIKLYSSKQKKITLIFLRRYKIFRSPPPPLC